MNALWEEKEKQAFNEEELQSRDGLTNSRRGRM
jgi:hypothetical protein